MKIIEDGNNGIRALFRGSLRDLAAELHHLDERVAQYDSQIVAIAREPG